MHICWKHTNVKIKECKCRNHRKAKWAITLIWYLMDTGRLNKNIKTCQGRWGVTLRVDIPLPVEGGAWNWGGLQLCLFYFLKRWQNGNNVTKWYNNMHELWVWVCEHLSRCLLTCYSILRREGYRRKERSDEMHLQELGKWYYIEATKPGAGAPTHLLQEQGCWALSVCANVL